MILKKIHKFWLKSILHLIEIQLLHYNKVVDSEFALRRLNEIRLGLVFFCTYQKNQSNNNEWMEFLRIFQLRFNKNLTEISGEEFFLVRTILLDFCGPIEKLLQNNDIQEDQKITQILLYIRSALKVFGDDGSA